MTDTVTIGRLTLHETFPSALDWAGGEVSLRGIEMDDSLTEAAARELQEDIRGLSGQVVQVVFSARPETALYARVTEVKVTTTRYGTAAYVLAWELSADVSGTDGTVDLESRLSGPLTRATDHALTGERWAAPPTGHYAFWAGTTVPSSVVRTGEDGAVTVYRAIPVGVSPRWGCPPASYPTNRVKLTS